jgi:hypothetical protein
MRILKAGTGQSRKIGLKVKWLRVELWGSLSIAVPLDRVQSC